MIWIKNENADVQYVLNTSVQIMRPDSFRELVRILFENFIVLQIWRFELLDSWMTSEYYNKSLFLRGFLKYYIWGFALPFKITKVKLPKITHDQRTCIVCIKNILISRIFQYPIRYRQASFFIKFSPYPIRKLKNVFTKIWILNKTTDFWFSQIC